MAAYRRVDGLKSLYSDWDQLRAQRSDTSMEKNCTFLLFGCWMLIAESVFLLKRGKTNGQTDVNTDHPTNVLVTAGVSKETREPSSG